MVWIGAKYSFASTFSYRIPYFSSSYALSAPAPSPSTIKLALVASTINRTGNIDKGKELFEGIHNSNVAIELPSKFVVFKAFMKRLKKKRQGLGFERTFGIREYILYDGDISVFLDCPSVVTEEASRALQRVQYFGTSDSICSFLENAKMEPDQENAVKHVKNGASAEKGIIFLLTDFTEKTTFENVNPFSEKKMKKENFALKPYLFPIQVVQRDKNCTIYKRIQAT